VDARKIIWLATGLLTITIALLALVIVPRQESEATPQPTQSRSARPALAAAMSAMPVRTSALLPTAVTMAEPTSELATPAEVLEFTEVAVQADDLLATVDPVHAGRRPPSADTLTPTPILIAGTEATRSGTATAPSSTTPSPTVAAAASQTLTPVPSASPGFSPAPTSTPLRTSTPGPTATALTPSIGGRVLLNGQPVMPGIILVLEDQSFHIVAETVVAGGGVYEFQDVPPSTDGYNVTFGWQYNQSYGLDEVIAWGWIGPVAFDGRSALQLPDLEIGLLGPEHLQPEPDTSRSATSISSATPLAFVWSPHPTATRYWVDILSGATLERAWHSGFTESTSTNFEGLLDDGSRIQPGIYWWAVGGQSTREGYRLTVYGHLASLRITL
jgi:hypothetical protein